MAYCRMGKNSDVCVYHSIEDMKFHCVCCRLTKKILGGFMYDNTICKTQEEMLAHLLKHKSIRHMVPREAFRRLKREIKLLKK